MPRTPKLNKPTRFTIAAILQEIGLLLGLKRTEPYRARAYLNAARAVANSPEDLDELVRANRLQKIKGVGDALAAQIREIYVTGHSKALEKLRNEFPKGVLELSQVLSLKKIRALHDGLGITSIGELKAAAEAGKIRNVRGFSLKAEQSILQAIEQQKTEQRFLLLHARRAGLQIIEHMQMSGLLENIAIAGSVRRWKETVSALHLVACGDKKPSQLIEHFLLFPPIVIVEAKTKTSCTVRLNDGMPVSMTAVLPKEYSVALHHHTGSSSYLKKLHTVASAKGIELRERSLIRTKSRNAIAIKSEAEIFSKLRMQYIPPELREDEGEIEKALYGKLQEDLITSSDIRGMTHCHTTYSDGKNSVEEMALAAEALGMQYITITDHSPTAFYANGVKLDRLRRQWDEIDRVQESVNIKLLRGTESDILRTGALDYPDSVMERFDVIIASIHNRYKMDESAMTKRVLTAIRNPLFKIWGHPLGRLLLRRPPFACRVEEVLDAIAESRAAIEINGDPHRMDMEPRWLKEARKRRIKFVISTDAHSTSDLNNLPFGIGIARRAGVRRREVLNTLGLAEFRRRVLPGVATEKSARNTLRSRTRIA